MEKEYNKYDNLNKTIINSLKSADEEKINFIFDSCKEYLINTNNNKRILQGRVVLILACIVLSSAFLFAQSKLINNEIVSNITNMYLYTNCLPASFLAWQCFYPVQEYRTGYEPQHLCYNQLITKDTKEIKILTICAYQSQIDNNQHYLDKMGNAIKLCMNFLMSFWLCHLCVFIVCLFYI